MKTVKMAMLAIAIAGLSAGIVHAANCTASPQCGSSDCGDIMQTKACAGNNECECALDYVGSNSTCSCGVNHD